MNQRKTSIITPGTILMFWGLGVLLAVIAVVDAGIYGGSILSRDGQKLPLNPISAPFFLFTKQLHWSVWSTVCAAFAGALILTTGILVIVSRTKAAGKRTRVDHKAALMGRGKDIAMLTERSVMGTAKRFGLNWPGIFLGITVAGNQKLFADVESVGMSIFGPRQGKSSTQVIPAVMDAPGAVLTTSNKPDVIDATRLGRSLKGKIWAFNPQKISDDPPTWLWDPVSYVTDDVHAQKLADIFKVAERGGSSKADDPYFDPEGLDLSAALFLAAAVDRRPAPVVYDWISGGKVQMEIPKRILREYQGGIYARHADSMAAQLALDDGQRDGIVGTAKAALRVLKYVGIQKWISPQGSNDPRPRFDPHRFVRESTDTLYVLSKEGGGSAAALTTALTVAVAEAAEAYAMTQPNRRMPVPLVLPLDEIANVCPWKDLPDKYSHYGSKGLLPMFWLQSYSQGVELWGEKGMAKIYSASTVKIIGSGLDEERFLREVSSTLGEYRYDTMNTSSSRQGRSVSVSPEGSKEAILSVSELSEMPIGRAIIKRAGARAVLVKTVQWRHTRHADAVWLSLDLHDPTKDSADAAEKILARKDADTNPLVAAYRKAKEARTAPAAAQAVPVSAGSKWLKALND
ncbi:type IV secretory system conjugative DNA transfer family protein [Arthrobacter bambusae]|uniref:type IV secretory system conjugative DNA transfer family protein n=1 Tax=Arthrobacter bambusae TaxID=1338426 RepID=UPI0027819E4E|nr:type IV secretory system conjugative DNA transfer family protein [Arthrobacter bambusae]MDQ0241475.1 type IV secretory pathway TraG/TraD family ATPase VirD4 [Arthrobacter bambusae]